MRRALFWFGSLLSVIGVVLIAVNLITSYMGLSASYNLGDPAKLQFILVPLWQIGLTVGIVGGVCLAASRRLARPRS